MSDFPRVDLSSAADLDRILDNIRAHALQMLSDRVEREHQASKSKSSSSSSSRSAIEVGQKAIDIWIASARRRLELNITANGLTFSQLASQKTPVAPFDQVLSQRVQSLAAESDDLTAQLVHARRTVPQRRADALAARANVVRTLAAKEEEKRQLVEEEWAERDKDQVDLSLPRAESVRKSLLEAVGSIDALQVALLEQTSEAQDHTDLVRRLRGLAEQELKA
ncbi:hypothetical protein IE81DRAFT_349304 [Ceraceosorus guamensis]|uniref:Uncharacterized protein n=1 Tax=Ceraceosorus guamensis TaxID=1522189 RepID=A0A316VRV9_9BASI|nr:hypothetical protein IE81DRAFT_349304 [Ceraceosorus guamensis]PWN40389.1 hypothetical protein IE81DRAFT_349304 [Ceraceosorus guamensis]